MQTPVTHLLSDTSLVGAVVALRDGGATARLVTTPAMAVDDHGLVHGGFVFGLADYAAMLAVNHPNVVLGSADVRFVGPVGVDVEVLAAAQVREAQGRKRVVDVSARCGERVVFTGIFTCFVLDQHVMESR